MTDDKLNELWDEHIEGGCVHEWYFSHSIDFNSRVAKCKKPNCISSIPYRDELPIYKSPDYINDPVVFKDAVVKYELDIDPPNCFSGNRNTGKKQWVVRAMSPNHNAITVIDSNLQHAVMLVVLKEKGVEIG